MAAHHTQRSLGSPTYPAQSRHRAALILAVVLRCWRLVDQRKVGVKMVRGSHGCQTDGRNMVQPNLARRSAAHQNSADQDRSPEADCQDRREDTHDSETMVRQADTVEASPCRGKAHQEESAMCHLPGPDLEAADYCRHLSLESCFDGRHDHSLTVSRVSHRLMKTTAAVTQHALAKRHWRYQPGSSVLSCRFDLQGQSHRTKFAMQAPSPPERRHPVA